MGCGLGLLSLFAAKAGAKHVYGVDMSTILDHVSQIVKDNNLQDRVTLIKGKIEDVKLPVEKVDIIVSDWMGFCLFYDSTLKAVLYARNKFLKQDGLMFPDRASLYLTAIEDKSYKDHVEEEHVLWKHYYSFNLTSIRDTILQEPLVDVVEPQKVVTSPCMLREVDLYTASIQDHMEFKANFELTMKKNANVCAFVAYFDVEFTKCHKKTVFTTRPEGKYTRWKQTVFYLDDFLAAPRIHKEVSFDRSLTVEKGEKVCGEFGIKQNPTNAKEVDFQFDLDFRGEESTLREFLTFKMRKLNVSLSDRYSHQ